MNRTATAFLTMMALLLGSAGISAQEQKHEEKDDKKAEETFKEIYKRLDIGVRLYLDWIARWAPAARLTSTSTR